MRKYFHRLDCAPLDYSQLRSIRLHEFERLLLSSRNWLKLHERCDLFFRISQGAGTGPACYTIVGRGRGTDGLPQVQDRQDCHHQACTQFYVLPAVSWPKTPLFKRLKLRPESLSEESRPLPAGERAARSCNTMEWVRGFGSIGTAGNPSPQPSPQMGRGSRPSLPLALISFLRKRHASHDHIRRDHF